MDKQRLLDLMRRVLLRDERVVFAYVYGSFVKELSFRDIDIGIYAKNPQDNPFVISSDIKVELYCAAKKANFVLSPDRFDIRLINHAPFTFLMRIFKEGTLLVDHNEGLRTDLIEFVSRKYRECLGVLAEASLP